MSYAVYNADCWCESCADDIKRRLAKELVETLRPSLRTKFPHSDVGHLPSEVYEDFVQALIEICDKHEMDSDDWPSTGHGAEAVDSPSHCGAAADCLEAEVLSDDCKIGALLGTILTDHGVSYLNEMLGEPPVNEHQRLVHEFWREQFEFYELVPGASDAQ